MHPITTCPCPLPEPKWHPVQRLQPVFVAAVPEEVRWVGPGPMRRCGSRFVLTWHEPRSGRQEWADHRRRELTRALQVTFSVSSGDEWSFFCWRDGYLCHWCPVFLGRAAPLTSCLHGVVADNGYVDDDVGSYAAGPGPLVQMLSSLVLLLSCCYFGCCYLLGSTTPGADPRRMACDRNPWVGNIKGSAGAFERVPAPGVVEVSSALAKIHMTLDGIQSAQGLQARCLVASILRRVHWCSCYCC